MDRQEHVFWRVATLIFAAFVVILYYPVLFGKIPFPGDWLFWFPAWADAARSATIRSYAEIGDLITYFYPARAFAAQSMKHGVLPLWNPLILSGEPFQASAQSSLFYPPNILYYVLPLPTAWAACLMLRMFLAALFMAMFVRSIGGSKTGSVFSGIVFASCGFMTAWQGQPMSDSAIWLPFACNAILSLRRKVSRISVATAAVGFAMPVLAGHPETAAHITLVGTGLTLALWLFPQEPDNRRFDRRFITGFALAGLLALGLASVQIIPTLEWLKQIGEAFDVWRSLAPHQALGWVSRDMWQDPNSAGINIPEGAAYIAMVSILVAPLAIFYRPRIYRTFLFIVALCAIAVAYGFEPIHTLVSHIPVVRALKNFRMLVAHFSIAGLSGLGISILEERLPAARRKQFIALTLVVLVFIATSVLIRKLQLATTSKTEFIQSPSFSLVLLITSLILVVWKLYGGLRGRLFPIAVCGLAMFDLGSFAFGYAGFVDRDELFPPSPAFNFLKHNASSEFRIIQIGLPYSPNAPLMYGLHSADGYEVRFPKHQRAFLQDLIDPKTDGIRFVLDAILQKNDRRVDLLNVKYVVLEAFTPEYRRLLQSNRFTQVFNEGKVAIFQNPSVLPRAWMVPASGIQRFREVDTQVNRLKDADFNPLKFVTIPEFSPTSTISVDENGSTFNGSVDITDNGITSLSMKTQSSSSAILVVSQTYYPGWKAIVDGKQSDVLQADVALAGIAIPAGTHEVRLAFQPLSFRIGLGVSILSTTILLALIAAWLVWRLPL
jgi:hypothetical protein